MTTTDQLRAIVERAEKATTGTWYADKGQVRTTLGGSPVGSAGVVVWNGVRGYQPQERVCNGEFIADARLTVPVLAKALLAVLERCDYYDQGTCGADSYVAAAGDAQQEMAKSLQSIVNDHLKELGE